MEKTKKRRGAGAAGTGAVSVSTPSLPPTPPDALQDLVFQLSNPSGPVVDRGSLQLTQPYPADLEVLEEGEAIGHQQQQTIQTSLDQLGNDISVIKTQLEKKKAKMTLVDVSDRVDQILDHLKGSDKSD